MHIQVYSDMVCPWCRIGMKNLSDAIELWTERTAEEIEVSHRAYLLDPSLPPEGLPFKASMERKMGPKLEEMTRRVTEAGANVGLVFRFDRVARMPNTVLAHRVTALLPEKQRQMWIDAIMTAYFEFGRDIAKLDVLLEVATDIGLNAHEIGMRLENGEGAEEVERDLAQARAMGISGVPFFVIDNKFGLSGAYPAAEFVRAFEKIQEQKA
ncbi:DsbA family oxidoreductase [Cohnella thailandensis]|uniref:DsbA family oxidoreductase n=1 Tax=Cohnella thailandensis TaxID=557557 RepID=A0A841T1I4_9BACL|nr:DsbA family oxidoreductase [Cohnella thailandensis]MBB6638034.1 DsbA family oxidoreductase [Cohnella thailandensis]MBP1972040.1 putative DsbA family dithiol-disulfide isomerase [Cohnella thailandensis]